ncbi:MAG: adenylyltransferase/cytidyltransferase family protein [Candidatus Saccharimonadales bacterium]
MKKIGIITGAFDPMHSGHIDFIDSSIEKYGLDKVLVLIEEISKFKQSFAEFTHRKKIVELSIKSIPKARLYEPVSASFPLSSTLPNIKSDFKDAEIYLLIGDDVEKHINTWPNAGELLKGVELIVTKRSGSGKYNQVSSGKARKQIRAGAPSVDLENEALKYCEQKGLYR